MTVRVGMQLYSVRDSLARDSKRTLAHLAEAGFTHLEAANHNALNDPGVGFGVAAPELRAQLATLGLSIVGCHINPLELNILPRALDYQAELGNHQFGCDIEFFPYGDRDYVMRRAELFNKVGELARARGMRFYYHNHFQEFQRFGDDYVYDLILDNTDPDLVKLEIDTYWMYRGGQDPIEWMKKCADRVILLHQKDFPAHAPQPLNLFDGVVSPTENIDLAVFFINGHYVATLDVFAQPEPGDLAIVTGFSEGNIIEGRSTEYEDFTVWRILTVSDASVTAQAPDAGPFQSPTPPATPTSRPNHQPPRSLLDDAHSALVHQRAPWNVIGWRRLGVA